MPNITEQNNGYIQPDFHDDEIDLFELVEGLWQQKWLVAAVTAVSAVIALVAVFIMQPTYQAEAFVRAPLISQLSVVQDSQVLAIDPDVALGRVEEELNSLSLRREVFDSNLSALFEEPPTEVEILDSAFMNAFTSRLTVVAPKIGAKTADPQRRTISFQHSDPGTSAAVINQLISLAEESARSNLLDEFRAVLTTRLSTLSAELARKAANLTRSDEDKIVTLAEQDRLKRLQLEDEIAAVKAMAAKQRLDQIVRLEEALAVARSLNITEPTTLAVMAQDQPGGSNSMTVTTDISQGKDPDYLKGTRVLTAELVAVKARTSDDEQIPGLRELEKRLDLLSKNREIEILSTREDHTAFVAGVDELREEISKLEELLQRDYKALSLLRIDQPALVPTKPIKPRKALILAAAIVAGGMLGVLIALIRNAAAARRARIVEG